MKIGFILSGSNTKGANGAFLELIDSLNKNRFNAYVILPSAGHMVHELKIRSIPFKIIYNKWWMHEEFSPRWKWIARLCINFVAIPRVCCQISKWQCDIIYTNTITVGVGLFASIILKKPHIFHVHEFGYIDHGLIFDFGKTTSLWLANKFTKYFIFVSQAVANEYADFVSKNKSMIIYQSVTVFQNKPKLPNIKKHKLQCVITGRLVENKGQNEAIEAVDALIKEGLDVGLWIIGTGEQKYKLTLEKKVESKNIKDYICFCGWYDNPLLLVQEGDVVLTCSRCEAFGRVTIEAMLIGKPVIGTKSGGTIELIEEGFNGFLYAPLNSKELAKKIRFFYENPSFINKIGKNAQQWAKQQFAQERYGKEVSTILDESLAHNNQ